jgi:uncharacterized membrane protein
MNQSKSPIAWLGYFILGIVVLIVAVQLLKGVLWLVSWIATLVLSVVLVAAVGYVVYALLKSASKSQQ